MTQHMNDLVSLKDAVGDISLIVVAIALLLNNLSALVGAWRKLKRLLQQKDR